MKKLMNSVDTLLGESLAGFASAHSDIVTLHPEVKAILRAKKGEGKVALISGGGSGHEPLHGGFVGYGMLDGACPGEVFTSPTPDQMLEAAKSAHSGKGVLYIIKNYTGDLMNFEMAAEMLGAEGVAVETVLVNDDVAVEDSLYTAGRRGVGGTVLVEKIAGAAAERGDSLEQVKAIAEKCKDSVRSMGVALTSCTVPAAGRPTFDLPDDEIEMGVGIHGEPGRKRIKMTSAKEIVTTLAEAIVNDLPFKAGEPVLAFVNGMGGTPIMELYLVYNELEKFLKTKNIPIARNLVGNYITSLDMQGCSITLMRMDEELLALWDAPVQTAALRWGR